jgi:hypothetical protein
MRDIGSALKFAAAVFGEDSLKKFEVWKQQTNTVVDHEEIKTALQIVPKAVLALLQKELQGMESDSGKDIELPVEPKAVLAVTKHANDVYSGSISQEGKSLATFRNRSMPGVGLVIMTTFELYDIDAINSQLPSPKKTEGAELSPALEAIVATAVEQKMEQKSQIEALVEEKIAAAGKKNELKLKSFVNRRKPEFKVEIAKNESVQCPDCGMCVFAQSGFSGCVCLGDDRNAKIYIRKTETGVAFSFPKSWDQENIELLLATLRDKKARRRYE